MYNPEKKKEKKRYLFLKISIPVIVASIALLLSSRGIRTNIFNQLTSLRTQNEEFLTRMKDVLVDKKTPVLLRAKVSFLRGINKLNTYSINALSNLDHGKNYFTGKVADNVPYAGSVMTAINNKLRPIFSGFVRTSSLSK